MRFKFYFFVIDLYIYGSGFKTVAENGNHIGRYSSRKWKSQVTVNMIQGLHMISIPIVFNFGMVDQLEMIKIQRLDELNRTYSKKLQRCVSKR